MDTHLGYLENSGCKHVSIFIKAQWVKLKKDFASRLSHLSGLMNYS